MQMPAEIVWFPWEEVEDLINTGNFSFLFCTPEMQIEEFARY